MPDDQIHFEEEEKASLLYSHIEPSSDAPKLVQFMIDKGWVGDKKTATYMLLGVVVVVVVITIVIFVSSGGGDVPLTPPAAS